MRKFVVVVLFYFLCVSSSYTQFETIFNVIKYVESNNNISAVGDNGKALGVLQIHKICVDDINRLYGTSFTYYDRLNEACSMEMFTLYLSHGITRIRWLNGRPATESEIVRMWNGGIYRGYSKKSTLKYYKRYRQVKEWLKKKKK